MFPGVETEYFYYSGNDKDQLVQAVKEAREAMVTRMGNSGVALFCTDVISTYSDWIFKGSTQARPMAPPPLYYTDNSGKDAATQDVRQWAKNYNSGQEDRDIILDRDMSRGWEVDAAIVVSIGSFYTVDTFSNLVMRGMSHVISVEQRRPDKEAAVHYS